MAAISLSLICFFSFQILAFSFMFKASFSALMRRYCVNRRSRVYFLDFPGGLGGGDSNINKSSLRKREVSTLSSTKESKQSIPGSGNLSRSPKFLSNSWKYSHLTVSTPYLHSLCLFSLYVCTKFRYLASHISAVIPGNFSLRVTAMACHKSDFLVFGELNKSFLLNRNFTRWSMAGLDHLKLGALGFISRSMSSSKASIFPLPSSSPMK